MLLTATLPLNQVQATLTRVLQLPGLVHWDVTAGEATTELTVECEPAEADAFKTALGL